MRFSLFFSLGLAGFWALAGLAKNPPPASRITPQPSTLRFNQNYGRLPLAFELNEGQVPSQGEGAGVKFLARGKGYSLFLTPKQAVLSLGRSKEKIDRVLRLNLKGANPKAQVEGLEKLSGISNYFIGNDPSKWRKNVPRYAKVKLKEVYPGIDMVYYGNQGKLEYDFIVKPGADPSVIQLAFNGARGLTTGPNGDVVAKVGEGEVAFKAPVIYQEKDGKREPIEGRYVMASGGQVGFETKAYNPNQPLVIDPQLDYSTYVGGPHPEQANRLVVDSVGNAYVVGSNTGGGFPTTAGAYQTTSGGSEDVVIFKLDPAGTTLLFSTYLGGSGSNTGSGIGLDSTGNIYVSGATGGGIPTTAGAYQTAYGGGAADAFVAKLDPTGSNLLYSTFVGGTGQDSATDLAVDPSGNAYVSGFTATVAGGFPTTPGAYQTSGTGAFVFKLDPTGSTLVYSTYLGTNSSNLPYSIAIDSSLNAYVTGTSIGAYPTTSGAFRTAFTGSADVFLTKLNATGSGLVYSTFLGGGHQEYGTGITVDASGDAYVVGYSDDGGYSTTSGTYQPSYSGTGYDSFVTEVNPTGSGLVYSTFFGAGTGAQSTAVGIVLDPAGNAYITGGTAGFLPTTSGAFQPNFAGNTDAFVVELNSTGTGILYGSYLGGDSLDGGASIARDPSGNIYICGYTEGGTTTLFPSTTGAYQTAFGGGIDAFVAKFDATDFYTPTPTPTPTNSPTPTITSTPTKTCTPTITFTPTVTSSYNGPNAPAPGTSFMYPSPATGSTASFAYNMAAGGNVQILVWNANAELAARLEDAKPTGTQSSSLNIQGFASGIYFYQVLLTYNSGQVEKLKPGKFIVEH